MRTKEFLRLPDAHDPFWLATGPHYVGLLLDSGNEVEETDEGNNSGVVEITISDTTPDDDAGNSLPMARDLGALGYGGHSYLDWIGPEDSEDYYELSVGQTSDLNLTLFNRPGNTGVDLLDSSGQVLAQTHTTNEEEGLTYTLLQGDTYYVKVSNDGSAALESSYTLSIDLSPVSYEESFLQSGVFEHQGIAYPSFWNGQFSDPLSDLSLSDARDLGVNSVSVIPTVYVTDYRSHDFHELRKTESRAGVAKAISDAQANELDVLLKPHVDPIYTVNGIDWRGEFNPESVPQWFNAYENMIVEYATIAEETGVSMFCVGVELRSLSRYPFRSYWEDVVAAVRNVYSGDITYAANWDEAINVSFWDLVDHIGIDHYAPLVDPQGDPLANLEHGWTQTPFDEFGGRTAVEFYEWLAQTHGKKVLFTEIGYRSVSGAMAAPHHSGMSGAISEGEQYAAYEAFFNVWSELVADGADEWFLGAHLYNWEPADSLIKPTSYTVQGNLAEGLVESWFGETLSFAATNAGVSVDLANGTATGTEIGTVSVAGTENAFGGSGNDTLSGNADGNVLSGGLGHDSLAGGDGNDQLQGGDGDDTVDGGIGDDLIIGGSGAGDDTYDGGADSDTLSYASTTIGVTVDLGSGTAVGPETGTDTLDGIEIVIGGSGDDTLIGSAGDNTLAGSGGDDSLDGGGGSDTACFCDDTLGVAVNLGVGTAFGVDSGTDDLGSIENAVGGSGGDTLVGSDGDNVLFGGIGSDILLGGAGTDVLYGNDDQASPLQTFSDTSVFPEVAELTPLDELPVPGDDALGIQAVDTALGADAVATLTYAGGTSGYHNSVGTYTVAADGTISNVRLAFENAQALEVGFTASVGLPGGPGATFGLFLVIHGTRLNSEYQELDFDAGSLSYVFDLGGSGERAAKITDAGADVSLVFDDGGTRTVLRGPVVHTTERGGPTTLNADGEHHVAAGRIDAEDDTTLRIGFEDSPGGGDGDFNDVIIDVEIAPGTLSADDTLDGGAGNDTMTGGISNDVFVFGSGGGTDRITDFEVGSDRLELLDGLTIASFTTVDADGDTFADDTLVTLSDGAVELIGVVGVNESDLLGS